MSKHLKIFEDEVEDDGNADDSSEDEYDSGVDSPGSLLKFIVDSSSSSEGLMKVNINNLNDGLP